MVDRGHSVEVDAGQVVGFLGGGKVFGGGVEGGIDDAARLCGSGLRRDSGMLVTVRVLVTMRASSSS